MMRGIVRALIAALLAATVPSAAATAAQPNSDARGCLLLGHHAGNEGAALGSGVHAAPAVPRIDQFHRTLHQVVPFLRHAPVALVEDGEPFVQAHLNVEEVVIGEGANPSGVDTGRNESHRANLTTRSALRWNRDIGRARYWLVNIALGKTPWSR